MEPFQDAVVLMEDQGHPLPTDVCPHPATAPLACSTAALDSGITISADIPEDIADIQELLAWLNDEVTSKTGILDDDDADIDDLLTWITNGESGGSR
ncbi:hypothetical protein CIB84_016101, partial [Bambusicola thoracicus]